MAKKTQNIDKFYVIETEKTVYAHETFEDASIHKDALATDFGKHYLIQICPQTTIFEYLELKNHKPVQLRGYGL